MNSRRIGQPHQHMRVVELKYRSKCTQTPVSKCYDPSLKHALRPDNVLSALVSYLEEWRRDSDERMRQCQDFSEATGLKLSTTAGTDALWGLLRELREKEEEIYKTVDIMLDVIRRGTANQTNKASIDFSPKGTTRTLAVQRIVQKAMGEEGIKQKEQHNQSLSKKKVVYVTPRQPQMAVRGKAFSMRGKVLRAVPADQLPPNLVSVKPGGSILRGGLQKRGMLSRGGKILVVKGQPVRDGRPGRPRSVLTSMSEHPMGPLRLPVRRVKVRGGGVGRGARQDEDEDEPAPVVTLEDDSSSKESEDQDQGEPEGKRRRKDHPGLIQRDMPTVEEAEEEEIEEVSIEHCKAEFADKDAEEEESDNGKGGGGGDDPLNTPTHSPEKADGDDRSDQQD